MAADNTVAEPGFWQRSRDNVEATWRSERYELYVPAVTWHNRAFYDRAKIDSFNERPWGLGFGRYRYDADGDWHALYAMAFLDSHKDVEPFVGYAYQKTWRPLDGWRLGAGFTAGVTARSDYSYIRCRRCCRWCRWSIAGWPCRPPISRAGTITAMYCSPGCVGSSIE